MKHCSLSNRVSDMMRYPKRFFTSPHSGDPTFAGPFRMTSGNGVCILRTRRIAYAFLSRSFASAHDQRSHSCHSEHFCEAKPGFAGREESYNGKQGTLSDREAILHVIPKDSSLPRKAGIPLCGTVQNDKWGRFPLTPTAPEFARFSFPLIRASAENLPM